MTQINRVPSLTELEICVKCHKGEKQEAIMAFIGDTD